METNATLWDHRDRRGEEAIRNAGMGDLLDEPFLKVQAIAKRRQEEVAILFEEDPRTSAAEALYRDCGVPQT
jgi:hypothetical protein